MSRIAVSGASGWIGRSVCAALIDRSDEVWALVRKAGTAPPHTHEWVHAPDDFAGINDTWPTPGNFDVFIHLGARVHQMDKRADDDSLYARTNLQGTISIADACVRTSTRRLVFLSSIKALGERDAGDPLIESDFAAPEDAYGRSKLAAERAIAERSGAIETVILRVPLVYGPGVKANFARLVAAVSRGFVFPLGNVHARRSFLALPNLVDALLLASDDPRAAGHTFHVADDQSVSVKELLEKIALALGVRARIIWFPLPLLRLLGTVAGKSAEIDRLSQPLRISTASIKGTLGWRPGKTMDQTLADTVRPLVQPKKN